MVVGSAILWVVVAAVLVRVLLPVVEAEWGLLRCELVVVEQLFRGLLGLLPRVVLLGRVVATLELAFLLLGGVILIVVVLCTSVIIASLAILGILLLISVRILLITLAAAAILGWLLRLRFLSQIPISHAHTLVLLAECSGSLLTRRWLLRPLHSATVIIVEIGPLLGVARVILTGGSLGIGVEVADFFLGVRIRVILSKCNLRLILGPRFLVIPLVNVVIRSPERL